VSDLRNVPPLPLPVKKALTDDEIVQQLNAIFRWPDATQRYQCYTLLLAYKGSRLVDVSGPILHGGDSGGPQLSEYRDPIWSNLDDKSIGLRFRYMNGIVGTRPIFQGPGQKNAIFLSLDAFTALVPYLVAELLSRSFTHGLVTRLILGRYSVAWQAAKLPLADVSLSGKLADPDGLSQPIYNLASQLAQPQSWDAKPNFDTYEKLLGLKLDACSVYAPAMVLGWMAGDALTDPSGVNDVYLQPIWKLIGNRFTTYELGAIFSYTIDYLVGALRTDRTRKIISGHPPIPDQRVNPEQVFAELGIEIKRDAMKFGNLSPDEKNLIGLSSSFFRMLLGEFFVASATPGLVASERDRRLVHYAAFLRGFQRGSQLAADVLFKETFETAYGLGYQYGFKDGYSQGFAAGWQAGYQSGYQDGQSFWSGFNDILRGVGSVLGSADQFLQNLGTAGTVIEGVAGALGL